MPDTKPLSPEAQEMLNLMLKRTAPKLDPTQAPPIPAQMLPQPPTVGSPEFLRAVKTLTDKHPEVKRSVSQFRQGPTSGTGKRVMEAGFPIDKFAGLNLLGGFDRSNKEMAINPDTSGRELIDVLQHEASHSQGAGEQDAVLLDALTGSTIDNNSINTAKKLGPDALMVLLRMALDRDNAR